MLALFHHFLTVQCRYQATDRILLAFSGGIDSVVLCHLLAQAQLPFGVAHINFGLRHADSDADQQFAQHTAQHYGVPYYTTRFDTLEYAQQHHLSVQMAARQLRYAWLQQQCQQHQYTLLATAHHQNDLAETMLHNLAKGTGIAGLHGIRSRTDGLIRPLLFANKEQIVQYATQHQLAYRHDASNDQTKYARNKIRHEVMPALMNINPQLPQTMYNNAQRFAETEIIYRQGIAHYKKRLLKSDRHETRIAISQLQGLPALHTILYELLLDFGFGNDRIADIVQALSAPSGKQFLSATHSLLKDRQHLIISPLHSSNAASLYWVQAGDTVVSTPHFTLHIGAPQNCIEGEFSPIAHPQLAQIDAAKLVFPLRLRPWAVGDYFYPQGMNRKKKKISRYFIDLKMSRTEKDRTWLLTDADNRILWVIGHRIDERCKVTPHTQQLVTLQCHQQPPPQTNTNELM